MGRVIKAGQFSFAPPETEKPEPTESVQPAVSQSTLEALGLAESAVPAESSAEEDAVAAAAAQFLKEENAREQARIQAMIDAEQQQSEKEQYQAAYDDLIQAAQDEAIAVIEDARKEAVRIISKAEEDADAVKNEAWESGYSRAQAQGQQDVANLFNQAQDEVDRALRELDSERGRMIKELERQMLELALDIAEKITRSELDRNDEAFNRMLKDAVNRLPSETSVTVRLNKDDYLRFFKKGTTAKLQTDRGQMDLKLKPDAEMNPYDLVVESDSGVVDAGMSAQIQNIGAAIMGETE